jgi:hypothetical protein
MDPTAHPVPETALLIDDPAPWSLRGMVLVSAIWNMVAAVLWFLSILGIPLGILNLVLCAFEIRYLVRSGNMTRIQAAEAARTLSSWEIGALFYTLGPFTCLLGIILRVLANKELARE